jgi:hypothetical protein
MILSLVFGAICSRIFKDGFSSSVRPTTRVKDNDKHRGATTINCCPRNTASSITTGFLFFSSNKMQWLLQWCSAHQTSHLSV